MQRFLALLEDEEVDIGFLHIDLSKTEALNSLRLMLGI